jgi:phosphoglycerate dehydrogenase-like enzyme
MARMPALQVVQLLTAGYDHALPLVPPGVTLCNAAGVHDASTAELALALILASQRGIDEFARAMPTGEWRHGRRASLADRSVLVIGAGGVGRAVASRVRAFEADAILVGRSARVGVRGVDELPDLLPVSDIVVVAVPLDETTRGLVDAAFLARMPDDALLVNVARGPIVDTGALLREAGRLRAALDVTDPEPLPPDHPLWDQPGVLVSPHVGGNTSAFLPRAQRLVADQWERWARNEPIQHIVSR